MTALGALPTNQPLSVGSAQRKMGAAEATAVWPTADWAFPDGAGGDMQITVTPTQMCQWMVQANILMNHAQAAWNRVDAALWLQQQDRYGVQMGHRIATSWYSVYGWQSVSLSAQFTLIGGTFYRCYLLSKITDGQTVFHQAARHLNMFGYTVGEQA